MVFSNSRGFANSELGSALDQTPGFFLILRGPGLRIEFANSSFLTAWEADASVIGRPLAESFPSFAHQKLFEILDEVMRTGLPHFGFEEEVARPGEELPMYYNYVCQPLLADQQGTSGILVMATDVTAQNLARKKTAETEAAADRLRQLYEAVTNNTPDLIYVFNTQYRFTYANTALLNMWGKTWEDAVGKGLRENGYEEWHALMHEREIDQIVATKRPVRGEVSFPHATLGKRIYDYLLVPVLDANGEVEAVAGTTRDISEMKQAEEMLKDNEGRLKTLVEKRTEELQRSNEDLQQFAHVASHDLKEPLRKIKLYSSRIRDQLQGRETAGARDFVEKIDKSSRRMQAMIDGILAYSTVSGFDISQEKVDLNDTLRLIREDLEVLIDQTGATLDYPDMPTVTGSAMLLSQLFSNLITNSLKFRKAALPPVIRIGWQPAEQNLVLFCVSDNGIGFPPDDEQRIFQTFLRLNPKDQYEGTGLGLALCKKIVERHGGSIHAHSSPGDGARFDFTLPGNG